MKRTNCRYENTYALKVKDDSMTNPNGHPSAPNGSVIYVDPEETAKNGNFVIAENIESGITVFRKMVIEGSNRILKTLNPAYPDIEIDGDWNISGKVVAVETDI